MDISNTFIKMCEKAEKIQLADKREMGSLYWSRDEGLCLLVYPHERVQYGWETPWYEPSLVSFTDHRLHPKDHHSFWLPRQDQLQEMVSGLYYDAVHLVDNFYLWYRGGAEPSDNCSMEQLWLAFVMKSLYSKIWAGDNWVASR